MKRTTARSSTQRLIVLGACMVLAAGASLAVALHPLPAAAQAKQQIDINIKDFSYSVQHVPLKLGVLTVINIRNEDEVRHDFNSKVFHGMLVEIQHDGMAVYGKGLKGVFLDPARETTIQFTPHTEGRFEFQCSIHKEMTGELLLLSVGEV